MGAIICIILIILLVIIVLILRRNKPTKDCVLDGSISCSIDCVLDGSIIEQKNK